jgi:protein-S-isoprenylcysteine O-methyltransferase Ste14
VAEAIAFAGAVVVLGALSSLNRSFGVAPENRGIKTRGLYRVVRHPMYLGYVLIYSGFVLGNVSWFNAFVLSATTLFLLMRLQAEERLLREDARYRTYAEETRWKLVPYVF